MLAISIILSLQLTIEPFSHHQNFEFTYREVIKRINVKIDLDEAIRMFTAQKMQELLLSEVSVV
jgi:hypothetical protein